MRLLVLITFVLVSAVYAYQEFQERQIEVEKRQLERQKFAREKNVLEDAVARESLIDVNQFIIDHPDSAWRERAIFDRDKIAYQQAIDEKSIQAMRNYLTAYPESQWRPQAEQRIVRLQNELGLRRAREQQQAKIEQQRKQFAKSQSLSEAGGKTAATRSQQVDSGQAGSVSSAKDRVSRALSIYQKQRDQERKARAVEQKRQTRAAKIRRQCAEVKDEIKQLERNRTRFYELDSNGERVFLSKEEVDARKREFQDFHQRNCNS